MLTPGDVLAGKYRIVRQIGSGGMGDVLEAEHQQIGKRVAVKILGGRKVPDEATALRFLREAQAAASIGHPGIIDIYDFGTAPDGAPYLVMEYLDGETLGALLAREGRLDLPRTAYVACQILSALAAAHDKDIIHRDLKPDNVFLVDAGRHTPDVKLLDFGISKMTGARAGPRLTEVGTVLGTPAYMSPEQAEGRPSLDHRIDIYAAGVIVYECLTGGVPFTGSTYHEVLLKVQKEPVLPPRQLAPQLPSSVESALLRTLSKDPEMRYRRAADLMAELIPFVAPDDLPLVARPKGLLDNKAAEATEPGSGGDSTAPASHVSPPGALASAGAGAPVATPAGSEGRRWVLVAAVLVVVVGGIAAGAIVGTSGGSETSSGAPATTSPAGDAAPRALTPNGGSAPTRDGAVPAATEPVTVRITGTPPGARVFIDDGELEGPPFVGRFPPDQLSHRVRAEAEGYGSWATIISFDRDRQLKALLELAPPPPAERPGSSAPAKATRPAGKGRPNPFRPPRGDENPWAD